MAKKYNKELSIQISLNGLSFCILNTDTNTIEHLNQLVFEKKYSPHEVLTQLKSHLGNHSVFSQDFKDVTVIHQNDLSEFVPASFYDESCNADYLKFSSKILQSDYITHDDLEKFDAKNVYVPYVNINNYIFDTFGQFTYKHALTVFAESLFKEDSTSNRKLTYINVNLSSFEIIVVEKENIILSNIHEFYTKEDFIYFVLFTLEQLEINPLEATVKLSGDISEKDNLYNLLYTYINEIVFLEGHTTYKMNASIKMDPNKHFLILNSF